jgi:hypothetical protein
MANDMIWAQLVHLGFNMWCDNVQLHDNHEYTSARDEMRFDKSTWDELMEKFVEFGVNTAVIDLGEGVKYDSHPEIAAKDAWTTDELRAELAKMREMGITPIPKMNFSACHDEWLGPYSRMLSTQKYYEVVKDLIAEVCELFDKPALFHLGMDEEIYQHQKSYQYAVVRQHELWWHDFMLMVNSVEKTGARAWIWSDLVWDKPDEFYARMPKSVVQSNWYYGGGFRDDEKGAMAYADLEAHGYDQIPAGANWGDAANFEKTVHFCTDRIAPERLMGFMQTTWKPTVDRRKYRLFEGASEVGYGRRAFEANSGG